MHFLTLLASLFHAGIGGDRKSTRLNSSHSQISYAVFCLKKKKPPSEASPLFEWVTHINTHGSTFVPCIERRDTALTTLKLAAYATLADANVDTATIVKP